MYLLGEAGPRLKLERERNRLTVEQAAVLTGVMPEQWDALEAGRICMHIDFNLSLKSLGFDPRFIGLGERESCFDNDLFVAATQTEEDSGVARDSSSPFDERLLCRVASCGPDSASFSTAIELMRRSIAAVDAFVGEGAAAKSPDLVAALMSATIQCENRSNALCIAQAIETATDALCQSMDAATELFGDAMDGVIEALTPSDEG